MTRAEFVNFINTHDKAHFDQFALRKLKECLNGLSDEFLDDLCLCLSMDKNELIKKTGLNLKSFLQYTKLLIYEQAKIRAKNAYIKKSDKSLYEQNFILIAFFYKQGLKNLPKWAL